MTHPPLPDSCSVAFKEWAGVCDALADGRQSLILRKGGIAEGPRGFVPEHSTFWLYPTRVHEAGQGLRVDRPAAGPLRADLVRADRDEPVLAACVRSLGDEEVGPSRPDPATGTATISASSACSSRQHSGKRRS